MTYLDKIPFLTSVGLIQLNKCPNYLSLSNIIVQFHIDNGDAITKVKKLLENSSKIM